MSIADKKNYLPAVVKLLHAQWPQNRTVNVVCHGHSVPAGYFATPLVDTFNAYPHLLHRELKERFPFAVINVIVTAIGGENSESGAQRFTDAVLCHRPDVLMIDYALNDRRIGLEKAQVAWRQMIEAALAAQVKVLLMTPTPDNTQEPAYAGTEDAKLLGKHAAQIRALADEYGVGLVDSLQAFSDYCVTNELSDLLSWPNHPNRRGHELVVRELLRWFPV